MPVREFRTRRAAKPPRSNSASNRPGASISSGKLSTVDGSLRADRLEAADKVGHAHLKADGAAYVNHLKPTGMTSLPHNSFGSDSTSGRSTVRVRFVDAEAVCLLAPFNNWSSTATPLARTAPGTWEIGLPRGADLHRCAFFVWERDAAFPRIVAYDGSNTF